MKSHFASVVLGALSLVLSALTAADAPAQYPPPPPGVSENYARAYRHFLRARSSYKTFSSGSAGYVTSEYTPFGPQTVYVAPGYLHERITPRGFERYHEIPHYATYTAVPWDGGYYDEPPPPPPPARRHVLRGGYSPYGYEPAPRSRRERLPPAEPWEEGP